MEKIVENQGLSFVAIQIFEFLDFESLEKAILVKKSWRDLIKTSPKLKKRIIVHRSLRYLETENPYFFRMYPVWRTIFDDFKRNRSFEDSKKLKEKIEEYFNRYRHIMNQLGMLIIVLIQYFTARWQNFLL